MRAADHPLKKHFETDFYKSPKWIERIPERVLSSVQKRIYNKIASYALGFDQTWTSQPTMAEELGLSRGRVNSNIKQLEALGLITKENRPGTTCLYDICHHPWMEGVTERHSPVTERDTPPVTERHRGSNGAVQGVSRSVTQEDIREDPVMRTSREDQEEEQELNLKMQEDELKRDLQSLLSEDSSLEIPHLDLVKCLLEGYRVPIQHSGTQRDQLAKLLLRFNYPLPEESSKQRFDLLQSILESHDPESALLELLMGPGVEIKLQPLQDALSWCS